MAGATARHAWSNIVVVVGEEVLNSKAKQKQEQS